MTCFCNFEQNIIAGVMIDEGLRVGGIARIKEISFFFKVMTLNNGDPNGVLYMCKCVVKRARIRGVKGPEVDLEVTSSITWSGPGDRTPLQLR